MVDFRTTVKNGNRTTKYYITFRSAVLRYNYKYNVTAAVPTNTKCKHTNRTIVHTTGTLLLHTYTQHRQQSPNQFFLFSLDMLAC